MPARAFGVVASEALRFPVPVRNFPVPRNIFPVNFQEFAWRRVRLALGSQPGTPAIGQTLEGTRDRAGNGFLRIRFRLQTPDSPILGPNGRKSPATSANIPVLWRLSAET